MIYLIITTSINNKYGNMEIETNQANIDYRKKVYQYSITIVLELLSNKSNTIKPIIVENNGKRETYLDDFNCDVIYTDNNNLKYNHKAENELLDVKYIINKYNIDDNDLIIKLTGRYCLLNDSFINLCLLEKYNYDVFIKFFNVFTLKYLYDDCVLGLFAIKCKYIKNFNYDINFTLSPEVQFANYIRENIQVNKIKSINTLFLKCCFADNLRQLDI
jgi:hypothetical protein